MDGKFSGTPSFAFGTIRLQASTDSMGRTFHQPKSQRHDGRFSDETPECDKCRQSKPANCVDVGNQQSARSIFVDRRNGCGDRCGCGKKITRETRAKTLLQNRGHIRGANSSGLSSISLLNLTAHNSLICPVSNGWCVPIDEWHRQVFC